MPKTVECPVKRWPGSVTFKDPIPLPDCMALERAFRQSEEWKAASYEPLRSEADGLWIPVILACTEKFDLEGGFTSAPFPGTPKVSSAVLIAWLVTQIATIYRDEGEETSPLA
jgi:hypothetical protein